MNGVNGWLTSLSEYIGSMSDELDNAKAENVKLRDAVMDMYAQIKETCDICDGDFCFNYDEKNDCCRFDTMVDELGIEVSE